MQTNSAVFTPLQGSNRPADALRRAITAATRMAEPEAIQRATAANPR